MNSTNEETPGVSGSSSEGIDQVGGQLVMIKVTDLQWQVSKFDGGAS